MASLKYGCITPGVTTKEYPVAASQYFRHDGVNAVYLDANGRVALALSATATLLGVAIVPKGRGAGADDNYWLSSATAGKDKIQVITGEEAKFLLPADTTVTASMKGNSCDLTSVNDGTATKVNTSAALKGVFVIDDLGSNYGGSATDIIVHINPTKYQAD